MVKLYSGRQKRLPDDVQSPYRPQLCLCLWNTERNKEAEVVLIDRPLKDVDLVFSTLGRLLLPNTLTHAWSKLVKNTGLKAIGLYDSRHTHTSLLLKQGVHPKIVQERLGYATISTTLDIYSDVAPGLQQAAANKFDDIVGIEHNKKIADNAVSKRFTIAQIVE